MFASYSDNTLRDWVRLTLAWHYWLQYLQADRKLLPERCP